MHRMALMAVLALAGVPVAAQAQGMGIVVRGGTTGLGVDAGYRVNNLITVRGGGAFMPIEPRHTIEELEFTLEAPSPIFNGTIDLHPFGGGFRISGGLLFGANETTIRGVYTDSVDIGGGRYAGEDLGALIGVVENTRSAAPWIGIGLGRSVARGVGIVLDLGVAFIGDPTLSLTATGPISANAQFQQHLAEQRQQMQEDIEDYWKYWPVASIGVRFGVGF